MVTLLELVSIADLDDSPPADEATAEREEGLVDVGAAVVADEQAAELVQPGEGALDHPSEAAEA